MSTRRNRTTKPTSIVETNHEVQEYKTLFEGAMNMQELLTERLAELEMSLESDGWTTMFGNMENEFSREGLRTITRLSRLYYLKNPIIKRSIEVKKLYVWANGFNIHAVDEEINEVIQAFVDDVHNQSEMTGHQAQILKEVDLETDGNLFLVFFVDVSGKVSVRSIPFDEIMDVICNPEDARDVWFYHRVWASIGVNGAVTNHDAYYPDWNHNPKDTGGLDFTSKTINTDAVVFHIKINGFSNWQFGLSEVYSSIDWAKAYREFLEDWATIMRSLRKFAWSMTTTGGKAGITAAKSKLNTRMTSTSTDTNPPPLVGSTFIGAEGNAMQPIKTAGATASAEDGRRILLMAAAGAGLPETFYGDASVGTLATAKSLDRPTELMMLDRQALWKDVYRKIINYVLRENVRAGGSMSGMAVIENDTLKWNDDIDPTIHLEFPPLISSDIPPLVQAIAQAATTQTLDPRTIAQLLMAALGVEEADEILNRLYPVEGLTAPVGSVTEAIRKLTEAIGSLK
jgi:hypothetical protein